MPACCQLNEAAPLKSLEEATYRFIWIRLGIALVIAGQAMMLGLGMNMSAPDPFSTTYWILHGLLAASALAVMALLGPKLVRGAWEACCRREISIEGLFLLTALGAFFASLTSTLRGVGAIYYEVVAITLIIYVIGKAIGLQTRSKALAEVERLREDFSRVQVRLVDGSLVQKPVCELLPGECVWVMPGEPIAVDGEVIQGQSLVRQTALTGEPDAVQRGVGDRVLAGTYTVDGSLMIAPKLGERVLDEVLRTVEHARLEPSRWQIQANRLMQWFFPFVVTVAVATFLYWWLAGPWEEAVFNSMAVLVVACPCALGLATPLAVWGGLAHLATKGLVARSGRFLDILVDIERVIFDKTGTLTLGSLCLKKLYRSPNWDNHERDLQGLICAVESRSDHPVARAFQGAWPDVPTADWVLKSIQVIPGQGIEAQVENRVLSLPYTVVMGVPSLMPVDQESWVPCIAGKAIYIAINGTLAAVAELEEIWRSDVQDVFEDCQHMGLSLIILSGDPQAQSFPKSEVLMESNLSPFQKTERIKKWESTGQKILFVGDGINDAGAMAHASVSIAMGGGASLALGVADAVLLGDRLTVIPYALKMARDIQQKVRSNLWIAVAYNIVGMGFAASGKLHPVVAVLLMLASSVIVSVRALKSVKIETARTVK